MNGRDSLPNARVETSQKVRQGVERKRGTDRSD